MPNGNYVQILKTPAVYLSITNHEKLNSLTGCTQVGLAQSPKYQYRVLYRLMGEFQERNNASR